MRYEYAAVMSRMAERNRTVAALVCPSTARATTFSTYASSRQNPMLQ